MGGGGGGGGGNLVRCKMLLKLAGWLQDRASPRHAGATSLDPDLTAELHSWTTDEGRDLEHAVLRLRVKQGPSWAHTRSALIKYLIADGR